MRPTIWLALMTLGGSSAACEGSTRTGTTSGSGGSMSASTSVGFETGVGGGCGLGGASENGTGCGGVSGGVKFSTDVAPIFLGCTGEVCHGAPTWMSTVGAVSAECCTSRLIVEPGNASHSYLVDKIEGQHLCGGAPMPLGLAPLSPNDRDTLIRWICEGAPND